MSSAIKTPAFAAKASNIQNEDGSSIYSGGEWSFKNASAVTRVTIKDDGKVGIGIESPASSLHVKGETTIGDYTAGTAVVTLAVPTGGEAAIKTSSSTGVISLRQGTTERMRIASDGKVGIGTTSPASDVHIKSSAAAGFWLDSSQTSDQTNRIVSLRSSGGAYSTLAIDANTHLFRTGTTERMRIDASGNVKIRNNYLEVGENTTSSYTGVFINGVVSCYRAFPSSGVTLIAANSDVHGTNTNAFQVRSEGAIYARFTSITSLSDIRFKEDVKPLTGCLSKIMQLKPSSWKWKDNRKQETTGFIAQEIEQVFPQFVTELEESEQGVEKPKAVGAAGNEMIANLVAAIQEQQAMIEELKAKVSALESK